jgi:hypothetical protein
VNVDEESWTVRVREGSCRLEIDLEGTIGFGPDDRTITHVAPGGRLRILERRGGHERELLARPGAGGSPQLTFELDGEPRPFDEGARAWLDRLLPELFRQTGIDAAGRVGRLLARGGVEAVLAEARLIRSDSVERLYLEELLRQARPSAAQVSRLIGVAAQGIESDYDLAELVVAALARQDAGIVVGESFGAACNAIDSDYDLRRVLVEVVRKAKEPSSVERALGCTGRIGSDYDRAELLTAVVARWPRGRALSEQFYTLARAIGSDYDKRRTLQAAAERRPLQADDVRRLLLSAGSFHSDYDLAELLVTVGGAAQLDGELATAFERAAAQIGSSYDRQRALAALARAG